MADFIIKNIRMDDLQTLRVVIDIIQRYQDRIHKLEEDLRVATDGVCYQADKKGEDNG